MCWLAAGDTSPSLHIDPARVANDLAREEITFAIAAGITSWDLIFGIRLRAHMRDRANAMPLVGALLFGPLDGGVLVAAAVGQIVDGAGGNDFASVVKSHRGRGLAAAVAAASILTFAAEGVRVFSAGEQQSMPPVAS